MLGSSSPAAWRACCIPARNPSSAAMSTELGTPGMLKVLLGAWRLNPPSAYPASMSRGRMGVKFPPGSESPGGKSPATESVAAEFFAA